MMPTAENEALILRVLPKDGADAIAADIFTTEEVDKLLTALREEAAGRTALEQG